jgi:hypothetical protein
MHETAGNKAYSSRALMAGSGWEQRLIANMLVDIGG